MKVFETPNLEARLYVDEARNLMHLEVYDEDAIFGLSEPILREEGDLPMWECISLITPYRDIIDKLLNPKLNYCVDENLRHLVSIVSSEDC